MGGFDPIDLGEMIITSFSTDLITEKYIAWLNDPDIVKYSEQRHFIHTFESCQRYLMSVSAEQNLFLALIAKDPMLGIVALFLSIVIITRKWAVTAAMMLVVFMMLLAGMYGLLGAHFSAVSQIIVYAGAIMVVFVFVIMLLNLPPAEIRYGKIKDAQAQ